MKLTGTVTVEVDVWELNKIFCGDVCNFLQEIPTSYTNMDRIYLCYLFAKKGKGGKRLAVEGRLTQASALRCPQCIKTFGGAK